MSGSPGRLILSGSPSRRYQGLPWTGWVPPLTVSSPVPTGALPHHAAVAVGLLRRLGTGSPGEWYAFDLDGQSLRGGHGVPVLR